ncbi:MAG: hypothetical protein ACQSGP_08970 [Frankia sp.]
MRANGVEAGGGSADGWLAMPVPPGVDPEVLDVVTVPAGLWARVPGGAVPASDDPAFAARPHPDDMMTVIVGAPGDLAPEAEQVAGLLAALPSTRRDKVVVAMYGGEPRDGSCLPRQLAECTGQEVIALHGLLLAGVGGRRRVTAVDVTRGAWWHPFAEQTAYSPSGSARLMCWNDPAPALEDLGAGCYRLVDEWFVQVVPAGLVLRREGWPVEPAADAAPFDPGWLDLIIDHPVRQLTDGVLTALGRLADALPGSARVRLRVVLPEATADAEARRLRWAVPTPQHLRSWPDITATGPDAVPSDALPSDAVLPDAVLPDAVLSDAVLSDAVLPDQVISDPERPTDEWPERWPEGKFFADESSVGEWPDDDGSDGAGQDGWSAAQLPDQRPPEESLDLDNPGPSRAPATLLVVTAQGRMCLI